MDELDARRGSARALPSHPGGRTVPRSDIVLLPEARCPWRSDQLWTVLGTPIGWAEANRLMCDLIHRGRLPLRVDARRLPEGYRLPEAATDVPSRWCESERSHAEEEDVT